VLGMLERGEARFAFGLRPCAGRETQIARAPHIHEHVSWWIGHPYRSTQLPTSGSIGATSTSPIREQYYNHQVVDHAVQYVRGETSTTNSLEKLLESLEAGHPRDLRQRRARSTCIGYLDEQAFPVSTSAKTTERRSGFAEVLGSVAGPPTYLQAAHGYGRQRPDYQSVRVAVGGKARPADVRESHSRRHLET